MMTTARGGRLLAEPGVVLVRDLGRTQRTKLAVLRRKLDVGRERVRWKNLPTGSVVGRRRHHPVVRLVRCLRNEHRRPPVDVPLGGVNVLLRQQRPGRASQRRVRARLVLPIDRRSPRRRRAARGRVLGVGMRRSGHHRCPSYSSAHHHALVRCGSSSGRR